VEVELHAPPVAVRARVMLAADAPVAAIARVEERERDAVAFLQRPPQRVGVDALAERVHDAGELVARHPAQVGAAVVAVVAPVVEVRAADRGGGVLDQDASRIDVRSRQRFELERFSGLVQHDGQSLGHGRSSSATILADLRADVARLLYAGPPWCALQAGAGLGPRRRRRGYKEDG